MSGKNAGSAVRTLGRCVAAFVLVAASGWAALSLQFAPSLPRPAANLGTVLLAAVGLAGAAGIFARRMRAASYAAVAGLVVVAAAWQLVRPSNERDWQVEVSRLPWAEIDGDKVTFHDVRNFDYRSETDFTPAWYDRTYDLSELDEADIVVSYWMGDAIAHLIVSFGFGGKDYLAVSIETRKEKGESYSTLAGFFRSYEIFYVVADERDLLRVRTNYRADPPEDVYVYRTNAPRENVRRLFLDYVREINELRETPKFYDTLTSNCTTSVWLHTRVNEGSPPLSWKILASGYVPEYAWEIGRLDRSLPFEELRRRSRINEVAKAADTAADFSQRIRAGLPNP